jgi:hypothetical protein
MIALSVWALGVVGLTSIRGMSVWMALVLAAIIGLIAGFVVR